MAIRLLHIADVHLDAPFRWLGSRGREQRQQLRETFRTVVDLALQERVDALLVAGDLFDSNSPSQDSVDLVKAQLGRLQAPTFVLPGTHDCLDAGSIYHKVDLGPNVKVFDGAHTAFEVGGLGLTVHGHANLTKTSPQSPLHELAPSPSTRFNVALAHGSLAMPGAEDDFPIHAAEIARSGMDYLALGHWHSFRDCSAAGCRAFYTGPPELLSEGQQGCVLLVEMGGTGIKVEQRCVGRRRCEKMDLPLDGITGVEEIRQQIGSRADPDLCLSVQLGGLRPLDLVFEPSELAEELAPRFFGLRVADGSHPRVSPGEVDRFPEKTVIGQFARRMTALVNGAATPEERRVREEALQVGIALLQGRNVLR